jgi:hypothetical protein
MRGIYRINSFCISTNYNVIIKRFSSRVIDDKILIPNNFDPKNGSHLQVVLRDKEIFILAHWNFEFPDKNFRDYDTLMEAINMNKSLQGWYRRVKWRFGYLHELPEWILLSNELRDSWLLDSSSVFEEYKNKRKRLTDERNRKLDSIKTELNQIETDEIKLTDEFYRKYPLVAISKIPVVGLPQDRYLLHVSKTGDELHAALEVELSKYKRELALEYVVGNGDIEDLIDLLKEVV